MAIVGMINFAKLQSVALRYLAQRDHSQRELQHKLHGYLLRRAQLTSAEGSVDLSSYHQLIQQVIDDCLAHNYLNDQRFVAHFIEYKMQQGYGQYAIVQQLSQKGIDKALIDLTLQQLQPDWASFAQQLIAKKFPTALPDQLGQTAEKRKIYQFLLRRGYQLEDFSTIFKDFFI